MEYCRDIKYFKCYICCICGKEKSSKQRLLTHVGIVHQKLNTVLLLRGLRTIQQPHRTLKSLNRMIK